ncbi:hypothetical protein K492DRAFT_156437 [Lichtheimia hyalospora FSU 10163]|nr:hypothetical protein K492DRAFT_156437 [Lichtheimia hyalospora FSU 10163]
MVTEGNGKGQDATERTGLLGSGSGNNYSGEQRTLTAVVDIEAGAQVVTTNNNEDQPRVPADLLVKTIRKTIRQHNKAKLYIEQQKELAARREAAAQASQPPPPTPQPQQQDSDSSSSDSDEESVLGTRRRKRDIISHALRAATDQWKVEHGWGSSASLFGHKDKNHHHHLFHHHHENQGGSSSSLKKQHTTEQPSEVDPVPSQQQQPAPKPIVIPTLPPLEHDIWNIARAGSVCALLAIAKSKETNGSWEKLALSTMEYGLKASASSQPLLLQEFFIRPWVDGRSAIEWAVVNDCQHFLANTKVQSIIEDCWLSRGTCEDWKQVPYHPCNVWKQFNIPNALRPVAFYLARWATPRYQARASLLVGLAYLGLHFATLANDDYWNSGLHPFEYAYYVFVCSDVLLELGTLLLHPIKSLHHPSTYLSLTTAGFLTASFVLRLVGLANDSDVEKANALIACSYIFLVWATPLMIFRLVLWQDNLCWSVYKARHLVSRCVVDALWVFGVAIVTLLAFWLGLAALQHNDMDCLTLLRHLALGALHAPAIPDTLYYQPQAAGVMLFFYLAAMLLILGALLTGSFLTTLITLYPRLGAIQRTFAAERAIIKRPSYGMFIPTVAIDLIVGFAGWIFTGLFKMKRDESATLLWLERIRQVLWIIIFLPVILLVGIIELVCLGYCKARDALSGYIHLK